jgi:hypothetical protein
LHERRFTKAGSFPGQQLVKPRLRQISDANKYVGKPRERIDAIEPGGGDQAVHHRSALTAAIRADDQPAFPAARYAVQLSLGCVVRQADLNVREECREPRLVVEQIGDHFSDGVVTRQNAALFPHPGFQCLDQGCDAFLAHA